MQDQKHVKCNTAVTFVTFAEYAVGGLMSDINMFIKEEKNDVRDVKYSICSARKICPKIWPSHISPIIIIITTVTMAVIMLQLKPKEDYTNFTFTLTYCPSPVLWLHAYRFMEGLQMMNLSKLSIKIEQFGKSAGS